jgi:hypothetical protein
LVAVEHPAPIRTNALTVTNELRMGWYGANFLR